MITALVGVNSYQRNDALSQLINAFAAKHGDLAVEKIEAEQANYDQIAGAIESLPFLATKKMVVLYDTSLNKAVAEKIETLIGLAGESTDLIMIEAKPDKRGAFYKQLKKLADFHEFGELDEGSMANWLLDSAHKHGAELTKSDANYMVQRVGLSQQQLSNDLSKLALYNPVITRQTIDMLTIEQATSTIFNLIDSNFSGNTKQAMKIYDEQRQQRVEPQAIHGMLVWQMHAVAVASVTPNGATDSGLSPFVLQKSQRIAKRMGRAKIIAFLSLLRDIDYKGKHETFDYDDAIRYAIISVS